MKLENYISFPSAEIGVAYGSEEDFDSNLHFLRRVDTDLFDDQRLPGTPSDRRCEKQTNKQTDV